jgi:hypothetical protein
MTLEQSRHPAVALLMWGAETPADGEGRWRLCLGFEDGTVLPVSVGWEKARVPSLMERYDALAYLGYAVIEGGAEAWKWREGVMDDGSTCLGADALIRPLEAEESAARGARGHDAAA